MTEPLKPRIDFSGPLEPDRSEAFRTAQTFNGTQADNFAPVMTETLIAEEEGQAEAVVEQVLRPKRSLWRKMVTAGLALFGVSVVGQGVQWTMNAWQTQDWVALGGCAAGALIVGAGVGSIATEWRRLWRLRQRAHERDEARDLLHSHAAGKGRAFCEKLAQQAGLDQSHPALQRWYAAIHETQNDREVVSLYAHLVQPVLDSQARREISRQGVLLVERRVAQHGVEAERLHARQRVVDHKLAAIQRFRHVGFNVEAAGGHRHRRFIAKDHAGFRVLRQQRQANHAVTAAQVHNFAFQIFRQILNKEACPDIQTGA
jgi:hypothetical protein